MFLPGTFPRFLKTEEWVKNTFSSGSVFLLLSKFLWRQGYIRLPETCSMDSVSDCVASCPDAIIRGRTAVEIFKESGVEGIWSNYGINPFDSELGGKLETILSVLCRKYSLHHPFILWFELKILFFPVFLFKHTSRFIDIAQFVACVVAGI